MKPGVAWNKQALLDATMFAPLHDAIAALGAEGFPTLEALNALLEGRDIAVEQGHVMHFVEQGVGRLAFEAQYEPRCYLTGGVQTRRDNWHDLLNALVWLVFPQSKRAINARHYHALTRIDAADANTVNAGGGSQRGAVRDTNTLLDESGVIVACADVELAGLLRDFRWKELFWQRRELVQGALGGNQQARMGFYLFGHGLYEKTLTPYIGMTGQGVVLPVTPEFFGWPLPAQLAHLDGLLADYLANPDHCRSTRELSPVPLLGVPGWAAQDAGFYDNTAYFRPGRRAQGPAA